MPARSSVLPRAQRLFGLAGILLLLISLVAVTVEPASAEEKLGVEIKMVNGMPEKAYFPETGHHLSGEFLNYWLKNGQFRIIGFPLTDAFVENGQTVQYFERARLELWPENTGTDWVIQGTLLGREKGKLLQHTAPFQPVQKPDGYQPGDPYYWFPETSHTLSNAFKKFWDERGGVQVFGYPISEEFEEGGFTVQYFERARFEWHPENAGNEYEILLGHLGKEYGENHHVDFKAVTMSPGAVKYDAGVFSADWKQALVNGEQGRWAKVAIGALYVRSTPDINAEPIDLVYQNRPLKIERMVRGTVEEGSDAWYELSTGGYVAAVYLDPLVVPTPPATYEGHWVDVNLSDFYAIAYDGGTPLYVAIITAGRDERTPKGVFQVQYRVEDETMDSSTVGFPPGHPEYYYLEHVMYTQYFLSGGYALHGNWWTPESSFGRFSSNGCVGLLHDDAYFFWTFLNVGSTVSIHF